MSKNLQEEFNKLEADVGKEFFEQVQTLKPCPFCGNTPKIETCQTKDDDEWTYYYPQVKCANCCISMKDARFLRESSIEAKLSVTHLITRWNSRIKLKEE